MKFRCLIWMIALFSLTETVLAQCPTPDFTISATACRDQNLTLTNLSGAGTFEWDYCTGDLVNAPTFSPAYTLAGTNGRPSFEYAKEGNKWYAFVTGTFTNRFYRITFDDPAQAPAFTENLGDLNGKLNGPGSIRIINNNGNWYGLLHNTNNGELLKLSFGNSLANDITVTSLVTGLGGTNSGLAVGFDGANGWVCVLSDGLSTFRIIRLGNDLSPPTASDILTTGAVANPNALFDVDLVKHCDQWYAFSANLGAGNINRLSFGTTLFQQPTITEIANLPEGNGRIRVLKDGEQYFLFSPALSGSFYKVGLGKDLSNITPNVNKDATLPANAMAVGAVLNNSKWTISVVEQGGGGVTSVNYANTCSVTEITHNDSAPRILYSQQGTYNVSLKMTNASGFSSTVTKSIAVSNSVAPDISITTQNNCVGNNVTFTLNSVAGGISSYDWNFDDGTSHSSATQPTHIYSSAGSYKPSVFVTASNGCANNTPTDVKLYDAPVPAFTTPSGLVCTNNEYTFTNNTTGNYDGLLAYQWSVDGDDVSTTRDLLYAFPSSGNKNVKLTVSIPGCSNNLTKAVNGVDVGPTVAFTFNGQCQNKDISFTNGSAGSVTGYSWTFGDGAVSSAQNPTHPFTNPGVYPVVLSTTGSNGCVSTTGHDVTVYTSPVPTLTLDLPPFSCSGTPSQFHDVTSSPTDSNIQSWNWNFGDNGTGTGKNPTHIYTTAGSYNVNLSITTDKGCTNNATKPVTITPSPTASFNIDPACVNQSTKLTDTSTGGIAGWQWKIGTVTYTTQNPQHTFTVTGNYSVQLNVTGQNSCVSTITKQVVVPIAAVPNFEVRNPCSDQPAKFTDITSSSTDPVAERSWTFNNTSHATGNEVEFTTATSGTYNTSLQVKTMSGCVYTASKSVTIFSSPVTSFNVSDDSGPPPLNVSFTNTSSNATSFVWNFKDGSATTTEISPTHSFSVLGDYAVDLVASNTNGCSKTATKVISVVIPMNELALEDFTIVKPQGSNSYRGYVRVRNNGNYSIDGFYITYGIGGGLLLKENIVAPLGRGEVGTFTLRNEFLSPAPSAYICAELDNDTNIVDNKACETFENVAVILGSYPNPADVYLNIESILPQAGTVHVRLFTASGGLAYDKSFDAGTGLSRLSLDVQNLSPGIYIAMITAGSTTTSHRILVAR